MHGQVWCRRKSPASFADHESKITNNALNTAYRMVNNIGTKIIWIYSKNIQETIEISQVTAQFGKCAFWCYEIFLGKIYVAICN